MTRNKKPFWQSKTLWINVLLIIITIFSGQILPISPAWQTTIVAVANILLRFITNQPLEFITKRGISS